MISTISTNQSAPFCPEPVALEQLDEVLLLNVAVASLLINGRHPAVVEVHRPEMHPTVAEKLYFSPAIALPQ